MTVPCMAILKFSVIPLEFFVSAPLKGRGAIHLGLGKKEEEFLCQLRVVLHGHLQESFQSADLLIQL